MKPRNFLITVVVVAISFFILGAATLNFLRPNVYKQIVKQVSIDNISGNENLEEAKKEQVKNVESDEKIDAVVDLSGCLTYSNPVIDTELNRMYDSL